MTSTDLMPALVFADPARRHRWDRDNVKYLAAVDADDGNGRTERECVLCHMKKITVHYVRGFPGHEWRTADGKLWVGQATPPCLDEVRQEDSEN